MEGRSSFFDLLWGRNVLDGGAWMMLPGILDNAVFAERYTVILENLPCHSRQSCDSVRPNGDYLREKFYGWPCR